MSGSVEINKWLLAILAALLALLCCGISFLAAGYISFGWIRNGAGSIADWGAVGDFVGGILNPVIAASALCMLGYSAYMQRSELKIAQATLKETKQELAATNNHHKTLKQIEDVKSSLHYVGESIDEKLALKMYSPYTGKHVSIEEFLSTVSKWSKARISYPLDDHEDLTRVSRQLLQLRSLLMTLDDLFQDSGGSIYASKFNQTHNHLVMGVRSDAFKKLGLKIRISEDQHHIDSHQTPATSPE